MVAAIVLGTVLVTLVTLDVVPAPQTSADGPTADPTHVVPSAAPILVDGQGCLVALDPALDDRLLCTHDLGPVWRYDDGGPAAGRARALCAGHLQPFDDGVPHPMPRYLDDGRRRVQEWLKVFASPAQARSAFDRLIVSPACENGQAPHVDPLTGPVIPLGAQEAAAFTYTDNLWSSDLMVLLVDDAVIQVAVTPLDGVPHDPDVLQLVALTAVARYQHRT